MKKNFVRSLCHFPFMSFGAQNFCFPEKTEIYQKIYKMQIFLAYGVPLISKCPKYQQNFPRLSVATIPSW